MSLADTVDFDHTITVPSGCDVNATETNDGGSPTVKQAFGMTRMIGDSGSGGTGGAVPSPPAGSASAGKFLKADGTWAVPSGGGGGTFVDNETVSGSGTSWTLAGTPSPLGSLQLFVELPGYGLVGLRQGAVGADGYSISGSAITTVSSFTSGQLVAWYRTASSSSFVDDETVGGSGTAWTLANTPSPVGSLQLFVELPSYGLVGLRQGGVGSDGYSISGTSITTVSSFSAGSLVAWYRK